ncbi:ATPase components of ABC transporters with duplicated ATPase domains [Chitinophaga sp. YR573]|uniref:ribosomal protection-like ABC-F family protein n=1 Tax=Chitinophaga sp. YR573 TaxID=1881040 RepID=UPI0008CE499A|nr:ABC-F family ATP-binding cassette domain-containing protein [Chitinophaga sp. YR573]SEW01046.1 ATPase components of ABC transporters with duplicated ATPase domains [Chitinophaga sp. YR573]
MLILQGITYLHPNRDLLFTDINLSINKQDKIALIGNNGAGKSTLLKILTGNLHPSHGLVKTDSKPYYIPQIFGQFNDYSVAQALQIADKLTALKEILDGNVTDENLTLLDDDWAIEERCKEAFAHWKLNESDLTQQMATLSGGQKTKVFLAGIHIHQPDIVLLDEPSNHLDTFSRNMLYDYINSTTNTLVVVSHDRTLLNLLNTVYELSKRGITIYGGNYDFYAEQKIIESETLNQDLKSKEKALRKAKETEKESLERQQKLDARGKKKQEKAGLPTISMNTLRNNAEKSTSRLKGVHDEKVTSIADELNQLRKELPDMDKMKMDFDNSALHNGKILVTAKDVNVGYNDQLLWKQGLDFQIRSGERIVVKGLNGSGKTTLIKMMLGELQPRSGTIERAVVKAVYIDQDYSLIDNTRSVYEQAQQFNSGALQEHEIKIRLNRFLFTKEYWDKLCETLSGGEKMRLILCCLTISNQAPDIIVLDEPTNNLDIQNIEILTAAINQYKGTLVVVSHDEYFLKQIQVNGLISLIV